MQSSPKGSHAQGLVDTFKYATLALVFAQASKSKACIRLLLCSLILWHSHVSEYGTTGAVSSDLVLSEIELTRAQPITV